MDDPRPEKVAVVEEVRDRLDASSAALLTEYRGLDVTDLQTLRRSLRAVGGEYSVYKNTLVRLAVRQLGIDVEELLTGPTAIAFVDPERGDAVDVAKVLKDFAKGNANLVVKGGVLGDKVLSADDAQALAEVAPRDELLARLAGALAAPLQQFAGLLQALPRDFAYGLQALIDQQGGVPADAAEPDAEAPTDTDVQPDTSADAEAPTDPETGSPAPPATAEAPAAADETPEEES